MKDINKKIIDAVIEKSERVCPGSLALIGIYGSAATGDEYERSDLDLLILINDEKGYSLCDCFILDDVGIGYDIYCTTWDMLEEDAECHQAHISKLMDAQIVYTSDDTVPASFDALKKKAADILSSDERYKRAEDTVGVLCRAYAMAMTADDISELRGFASYFISVCLDTVMLRGGRYFRMGVKRTFEELEALSLPDMFRENIYRIVNAKDDITIKNALTELMRYILSLDKHEKCPPTEQALRGSYEEMFSNWRNKMYDAAERNDAFSSFMNMASMQLMLCGISLQTDIEHIDVMSGYDPDDLKGNAERFDAALEKYSSEYDRIGIRQRRFDSVDSFVRSYLDGV